jgi:predicted ABC-type ATPase
MNLPFREVAVNDRPRFWIIGGPNGSGKSTLYGETKPQDFSSSIWIINPDLLTRRIQEVEGLEYMVANVSALDRIMEWIHASLKAHQTVGVETVLSTDKYRAVVKEAQSYGHEICFAYVYLATPELNIERVALRVRKGGHDVEADKIKARRERSLNQMTWFFEEADRAWIFDNSGEQVKLIAAKDRAPLIISDDATAEIRDRLTALFPE